MWSVFAVLVNDRSLLYSYARTRTGMLQLLMMHEHVAESMRGTREGRVDRSILDSDHCRHPFTRILGTEHA